MINVMIVDDELEIRKGMHLKVDWEELGFNIIAEAANGAESLEKLHQLMGQETEERVDVIITDMNMPVMDGVGLLSTIQDQYPHIKAIVLTGYDDFTYTKAAIRHRAVEYLLKPVMSDELEQVLLQLKKTIHAERMARMVQLESNRMHQCWIRELREKCANHTLKGDLCSMMISKASTIQREDWVLSPIQVKAVILQVDEAS